MDSPYDIRRLMQEEDRILDREIDSYISKRRDVVFVEIGCGTGRYIRRLYKAVLTSDQYRGRLKSVVGVDFSKKMINSTTSSLVSTTSLANGKSISLLQELKDELDTKTLLENITRDVVLINADATKPFLRVKGAELVIGIMFGTLGNIEDREAVLRNIRNMLKDGGTVITTVFNKEASEVGFRAYNELATKGFDSLTSLEWDNKTSDFRSTSSGFYSHWFSYNEFKELLYKTLQGKTIITPIASQGLMAVSTIPSATLVNEKKRQPKLEMSLLCPYCSVNILSLPTQQHNTVCPVCNKRYNIFNSNGFLIPSLFAI